MPRVIFASAAVLVLAVIATGCVATAPSGQSGSLASFSGSYRIPKQIRYSYTLKNTTGKLLEHASFKTYAPVPQTSHQKVTTITANYPYSTQQDELGNVLMEFDVPRIPPYGATIISITVDLMMSESGVSVSDVRPDRFLKPEPYIESDDPKIVTLASSMAGPGASLDKQKAFKWVAEHMFAESFVAEDRGAVYALNEKKGDCTEFAYLLTALYRAQGIPARPIAGYVFSGNDIVKAADYHNWTEFLDNGVWQIADAQKQLYREKQTHFVTMRRIASDRSQKFSAQRFSFAGQGLEVSMN